MSTVLCTWTAGTLRSCIKSNSHTLEGHSWQPRRKPSKAKRQLNWDKKVLDYSANLKFGIGTNGSIHSFSLGFVGIHYIPGIVLASGESLWAGFRVSLFPSLLLPYLPPFISFVLFCDGVSLSSPGWPQTRHYLATTSQQLGFYPSTTTWIILFF